MEAKDLIIRSWVMLGKKKKLRCYGANTHTNDVFLENGVVTNVSELTPIPLTTEILEKNGFEKVLDKYKLPNYRIKWPSNGEYYFTIWTAVDGYWSPVGFGITLSGIPCEIDYVHQLQMALRLCGITREIII